MIKSVSIMCWSLAVLVLSAASPSILSAQATLSPRELAAVMVIIQSNRYAPGASAGADITQSISSDAIQLNASGSGTSPDDILSFSWDVISQPVESNVILNNQDSATPSFLPTESGVYRFRVTVTDTDGYTNTDTVFVTITNEAPVIQVAPFTQQPLLGDSILLDASGSSDADGHPLTYDWHLIQQPAESGLAPQLGNDPSTTVQVDEQGDYVVQLTVSDGYASTVLVLGNIDATVYRAYQLAGGFTDAEFDENNDRIVTINGRTLTMVSGTGVETIVTLPTDAQAVSINHEGTFAAVAHDGWISRVDLNAGLVLATHSVPANILDVVLDDKGFAHCFTDGNWINPISVNLATGSILAGSGRIYGNTRAKLHMSGDRLYGADNGLSPSDLERYSIVGADNSLNVDYDSPYHGSFPFCGDIWMHPSGGLALSRCRVVVRTTNDRASDLTYVMQLDNDSPVRIQHASVNAFDDEWLVANRSVWSTNSAVEYIDAYDVESGVPTERYLLPRVVEMPNTRWSAMFVFGMSSSGNHYVLGVDSADNPQSYTLLLHQATTASDSNQAPTARVQRYYTVRESETVVLNAADSTDPEGETLTYSWSLVGQPVGSSIELEGEGSVELSFSPTSAGEYEFELEVSDGVRSSPTARATVNVFASGADLVHRLEGEVRDLEYSKSLNVFVAVHETDLRLIDGDDFSEQSLQLPFQSYSVGVSPNGLFAAVSHANGASLIDLSTLSIIDSQVYYDDWGDIVLDHNNVAHVVPNRDQWSYVYSLDFANDASARSSGPRAGTQIRMHPTQDWIYGADRGLSPSDFEKYDTAAFPAVYVGDSPYHGTYPINGNIWISEDGDRLVVASGGTFNSSSDPSRDMTYAGLVAPDLPIEWADHSTERDEWVVIATEHASAELTGRLLFYSDRFFNFLGSIILQGIPVNGEQASATASHVFYSDDGSTVYSLLKGASLLDRYALQVSPR